MGSPSSRHRVSPLGEEFEVAGRAGPVRLMHAPPIPAQARAELMVLKRGALFLCARPTGDVCPGTVSGEGLYTEDTRFLSELRLAFGEVEAVLLSHTAAAGYRAVVDETNPTLREPGGASVPQEMLHLRRTLLVAGRLYCLIELRNYHPEVVTVPLALSLAADYADVFEIRGVRERSTRGRAMVPQARRSSVAFAYEGQDGVFRETFIELDRAPDGIETLEGRVRLSWSCSLPPRGSLGLLVSVTPGGRRGPRGGGARRSFRLASQQADEELERMRGEGTLVESDNEAFDSVLAASLRDLHALLTPANGGRLPAAGIPWFVAPFGRDSLWTSHEALMLDTTLARDTLLALAAHQARVQDPERDAEPGKILHELRSGELARAGLVPHTPYYGTVDATPLFLMLAAAYHSWTADHETLATLRPAIEGALAWIDRYGDADGDGLIEYERRSSAGLTNQGWKDSEDSVMHADGTLAQGPIALAEVQGYVHLAKLQIADVYEQVFDESERAQALRAQAQALREAFNEAFWDPAEGTFALALDGAKRQVRSVASNPGHCLYCGIVDPPKAAALAERLMAPDMFSGWGVRTLSALSPAYNPMSYHNGSVWPHDNAIIAAGLKRYGFIEAAQRIATAIFDIATRARNFRLAELYCGFERKATSEIVSYPFACVPHAWAAAAPFMLLGAMLGLAPQASTKTLGVSEPSIPAWLGRVELRGLRVGRARVHLAFTRADGTTGFSLVDQQGEIAVTIAAASRRSKAA